MEFMDVTLDVSKLSGWLNAVFCRVEGGDMKRGEVRGREANGQWSGGGASSVQGRARREIGRRTGAERTLNMASMDMTWDVSRLSGWLNASASCQVESRAYEAGGMREDRREGVGRRVKQRGAKDSTGDQG